MTEEIEENMPSEENIPFEESEESISSVHKDEEIPSKAEFLFKQLQTFYQNRYYWETLKSVVIFMLGLKIAKECYHIAIPMREYIPFSSMQCR